MKYVAREPQLILTESILGRRRLNGWADIGLGKTGATLDALDCLAYAEPEPVLVIAPKLVAEVTWPDEIGKWDHLGGWRASAIVGSEAQRRQAMRADANLFTVNFENVPWFIDQFAKRPWPFRTVVFDESTRLQGFRLKQGSAQAGALGKVAHTRVKRWINLTGTPAPNGLLGLWGQNWFVDAGDRLGKTFGAYQDRWFQRGYSTWTAPSGHEKQYPAIIAMPWSQEEIEQKLSDCTVSLDARTFYPDLKEPLKNIIKVRLPTKARLHYQQMEKDYFTEVRGREIEAVHAASKSIKLLQIASGAVWDNEVERDWHEVHTAKLEALQSLLYEASGAPVLAVYQFKPSLYRMQKAFKKGVLIKSAETIKAWNAGKIALGFVHPQSIGHGISLQDGGNIICHFDQWWDFERHDQINGRLGPMRQMQSGYNRDVFQHYIVAEGTLDEDVLKRHDSKCSVQDSLRAAMANRG